jgi:hypothetical protein
MKIGRILLALLLVLGGAGTPGYAHAHTVSYRLAG